jgi:hypothetical protein
LSLCPFSLALPGQRDALDAKKFWDEHPTGGER